MSIQSETFGRLLRGAINAIAAYEGTTAPVVEDALGAQIGVSGASIQRYKGGAIPPEPRTVQILAEAGVRRGFLAHAWLSRFLQAARYPTPEALLAQLADALGASVVAPIGGLPTGTVALLFTDIAGSTIRWEQQPRQMERDLVRHDAILRQAVDTFGGQVFKTAGDAFYAVFTTAPAALEAALAAQRALLAEPWGPAGLLSVRMAIHVGAPQQRDGDYFGPPLNRSARILSAGHGGQLLLSLAAQELACDQLPAGVELRDLGEHRLKDLGRPERIFQLVAPDLPADFPPLHTLNAYRHNLPAQSTALIGRERDVEDVVELLARPNLRLLTLSGPGGTGKTRLALQAAGELAERFADGVWFVGLAPISDPALVASAIAGVFGLHSQGDRPLSEVLREYLCQKELLLLLDNIEQVLPASGLVAELLAASPRLKILITSRAVLRIYGEHEYIVRPLSLPERTPPPTLERVTQYEAVQLFIERARAVRADFAVTAANAPQIAEICHRLDGLPLAIELAAARSKLFAPQAMLSRLDRRLATLTGGAQNLPARQQTLRGAINWSYDLLDAAERESFARLSAFVGGCSLEAAAAVLTAEDDLLVEPLDMLASLVGKNLLTQVEGLDGEPRFDMLETIREYALERLEASGEATLVRQRHTAYYLALVESSEHLLRHPEQVARLQPEYGNLRSALQWTLECGASELLARLSSGLVRFWEACGMLMEGRHWLAMALARRDELSKSLCAKLLWATAELSEHEAEQQQLLEESLMLFRLVGDTAGIADVVADLGQLALEHGDTAQARRLFSERYAIWHELGDRRRLVRALVSLGDLEYAEQQHARAVAQYEEALALARELEDSVGITVALRGLGDSARDQGAYDRAALWYSEALAHARGPGTSGRSGRVVDLLLKLGDLAVRQQALGQASAQYAEALRLMQLREEQDWIAEGLARCAGVAAIQLQWARAVRLWGAADLFRSRRTTTMRAYGEMPQDGRGMAMAQAALGDEGFAAAWAAGRSLSLEAAVAEALMSAP